MQLLGVILVCSSSRGHQLVFRYPMEADDDPGIGGAHAPTTTMMDYPPFLSDFTSKSATLQVFQGDEDEQQQLSAKNMTGNGRWLVADQPYKPSKMAASTSATTPTALIATSLLGGAGAGAGGGTGGETEGVWASYQPGEGAHGPLNPGLELSDHHTSGGSTLQSYSGLLHPVSSETTSSAADEPSSINRTNNNYTSDIRSSTSIAAAVGGDSFSTNNSNSVNSSTNPPVSSSSPSSFSSSNSPSSSSSDTFLGFPPHILSDILSPKAALCDRKFQLTIDGITFLGSPTLLNHG